MFSDNVIEFETTTAQQTYSLGQLVAFPSCARRSTQTVMKLRPDLSMHLQMK